MVGPACTRRVKRVEFGVLGPDDIRKLGVVEVTSAILYKQSQPRDNSLNDLRMGTSDPNFNCSRCHNNIITCTGHPGYIELPIAVYHVAYVSQLVKILRSVCLWCDKLLVLDDDPYMQRFNGLVDEQLFVQLTAHLKTKRRCPWCSRGVPKYTQHGLQISREWSDGAVPQEPELLAPLTPALVRQFMLRLSPQLFKQLGLHPERAHPANWILECLLVPPPIVRPSVVFGSTTRMRGQDDLTQRLQEILKTIERYKKFAHDPSETAAKEREKVAGHLQLQVATYMNNDCSTGKGHFKPRSGRPMKSISKRLKGKKGRARANLNGKRVNHCGRGPVTPDPNIAVDEIGIPEHFATTLTRPETAQAYNLQHLQRIVDKGAKTIGGAQSVDTREGRTVMLQYRRKPYKLQLGDRVHRYIRKGDHYRAVRLRASR